jgi:hypothetical protein
MPVLECRCGMVMSVPASNLRASCIRCGGGQLDTVGVLVAQQRPTNSRVRRAATHNAVPLVLQLVGEATVHVASHVYWRS